MSDRDVMRLKRRLWKEGYKTSGESRKAIAAAVSALDDYCVICRQDKGHRRAYGYGGKPNPIAFGRTFDVTVVDGVAQLNSPPLVVVR